MTEEGNIFQIYCVLPELWRKELCSILKIQHVKVLDSSEIAHTGFLSTVFLITPNILLALLATAAHCTHEFREITAVTSRCIFCVVTAGSEFSVTYRCLDNFSLNISH